MLEIHIKHDLKDFNLNQMINDARTNKYGSASKKKKLMDVLHGKIKDQVQGLLDGKYHVAAKWLVPTLNRDLDNLMLKAVFDCMQENGMLKNDNLNHIASISHCFDKVKKEDQGLIIKFTEI